MDFKLFVHRLLVGKYVEMTECAAKGESYVFYNGYKRRAKNA